MSKEICYNENEKSWLELTLHYCDPKKRDCKDETEIEYFFSHTVVSLKLLEKIQNFHL